jgi:hypothetical protein
VFVIISGCYLYGSGFGKLNVSVLVVVLSGFRAKYFGGKNYLINFHAIIYSHKHTLPQFRHIKIAAKI